MSGQAVKEALPHESGADVLTGEVAFTLGRGCASFDGAMAAPGGPTPSPSASPWASASPTATPSASPSGGTLPVQCPAQSTTTLDRSTITAMQSVNVTVTGAPATVVDLYAYTRPPTVGGA